VTRRSRAWPALLLQLLAPAASPAQVASLQADSARGCAVCHLSWSPGFRESGAVLLMDRPQDTLVSASDTCLGCHDGSVGDSRRRVWLDHGHEVGIAPPPGMNVPEQLPLTGGRLDCRTCHSAHPGTGPETLATTVFIRVPNERGQLCCMCHTSQDPAVAAGQHFMGRMAAPARAERRPPHAVDGPHGGEVTCLSCHTPHGGAADLLLSAGAADLCTGCHAQTIDAANGHPMGLASGRLGPTAVFSGAGLLAAESSSCLACHRMHAAGTAYSPLLGAATDDLCAACHAQISERLAGAHDFRAHPDLRNAFDAGAAQAGRCGFCHSMHRALGPALWAATTPAPALPDEFCSLCHTFGGLAPAHVASALAHPRRASPAAARSGLPLFDEQCRRSHTGELACATCHDPHGNSRLNRNLLRTAHPAPPEKVCSRCHPQAMQVERSLHSRGLLDNYFVQAGLPQVPSTCGPCHVTHGRTPNGDSWAGPRAAGAGFPDASRCLGCHGPRSSVPAPAAPPHPRIALGGINPLDSPSFMPLIGAQGEMSAEGWISCRTCHLPHGRTDAEFLNASDELSRFPTHLRAFKPMLRPYIVPNLCSACHGAEGLYRFLNYHDRPRL
jgi:predicted CXXCH cytochrome family protein